MGWQVVFICWVTSDWQVVAVHSAVLGRSLKLPLGFRERTPWQIRVVLPVQGMRELPCGCKEPSYLIAFICGCNSFIHRRPLWLHVFVKAIFQQVPERCLEEGVSFLNPAELPKGLGEAWFGGNTQQDTKEEGHREWLPVSLPYLIINFWSIRMVSFPSLPIRCFPRGVLHRVKPVQWHSAGSLTCFVSWSPLQSCELRIVLLNFIGLKR